MEMLPGFAGQKQMQDEQVQASPRLQAHIVEARTQQASSPHHYKVWKPLQEAATQETCAQFHCNDSVHKAHSGTSKLSGWGESGLTKGSQI